jgi:bifunctional DNA-binding transcriptional regulator/antitoxin component of YhaV-PrlF toxin-antitoxin module
MGKILAYPRNAGTVTFMKTNAAPAVLSFKLNLDDRRRPTLPAELLQSAGIDPSSVLLAYTDVVGRIILEAPDSALEALRKQIAEDKAEIGFAGSLLDELFASRAEDAEMEDE